VVTVTPNSRTHWALLIVGVVGGIVFNLTYLINGLVQPGYDAVREPMSALSLGDTGWIQRANFILFGLVGCVNAFGWRPTLAPGPGATWYPRLRFVVGIAMIGAGVFSQDPDGAYPVGAGKPAQSTPHATAHNLFAVVSLVTIVVQFRRGDARLGAADDGRRRAFRVTAPPPTWVNGG
jgi:hypothetical protein